MLLADRFRLLWTPFLRKQPGRTMQAVGLVCPPVLGSGGELTLRVGSRRFTARTMDLIPYPTPRSSQNNPHVYLWLVPRPARPVMCRAAWTTPAGQTYKDVLKLTPAEPLTIHVVFKTHLDIGYTHRPREVVRLYQTELLERLLEHLDRTAGRPPHRRFVWTVSTWLLEQCLDPRAVAPEHRRRLEHYIRRGQVVWGLMPFTTHSEFFGLEEMCRSLYAARRLAERFDQPVPAAAKMTDVPAHTASLAMAFAAAGGRFVQIGANPNSLPPGGPPLFWWDLPDEKRILCHWWGTYGTSLLPPPEWPWRHWLAVQITDDNVGPRGLDVIDHLDWIEQRFDSPVCRTGRLEDFARAVVRRHGRELPHCAGEPTDWWIHGIASQARPTAGARRDKDRLPSVETLHTLAGWCAGRPVPERMRADIRHAYEQLALYTEHTWGDHATDARRALPKGNLYTSRVFAGAASPPPVDRWVASWRSKAQFAVNAGRTVDRVESMALASYAERLGGGRGNLHLVVFNTLSWPRGGLVRLRDRRLPRAEFELVDPTTGQTVLYERAAGGIEFIAPRVPPCGYLALEVRPATAHSRPGLPAEWDERNLTMHVAGYSLQFDSAGGMSRWHDRAQSQQWCASDAEFPLGAYLYEMPGGQRLHRFARAVHTNCGEQTAGYFHRHEYRDMTSFGPVSGRPARITQELTPLYARVTVAGDCPVRRVLNRRSGDARRYRTTFTCYRDQADLHVKVELIGKRATYAAEAGYACFPFAGEEPWILIDRVAHAIDPREDLAPGVNRAAMAVHHGIRIENQHAGMNFYPLHTPVIGFGEPNAYRFAADHDYRTGVLYANLFNNCWGTNFALWQAGDFAFDFVCRPTGNDEWDGGLVKGGAEVFRPLLATLVAGLKADLACSLLRVEPDCVQLVALKPADFGAGTAIRLWNADVDPARARLTLPTARRRDVLRVCDLLERPGRRRIPVSGEGEAVVPLGPQEIVTLLLEPSRVGRS